MNFFSKPTLFLFLVSASLVFPFSNAHSDPANFSNGFLQLLQQSQVGIDTTKLSDLNQNTLQLLGKNNPAINIDKTVLFKNLQTFDAKNETIKLLPDFSAHLPMVEGLFQTLTFQGQLMGKGENAKVLLETANEMHEKQNVLGFVKSMTDAQNPLEMLLIASQALNEGEKIQSDLSVFAPAFEAIKNLKVGQSTAQGSKN
ncbi:MAG: hypothetical protein JNK65_04710 [Deltaproteobacteria bacterium]|nr:hypothetical protein [Deltaproteobacteria bacterium]